MPARAYRESVPDRAVTPRRLIVCHTGHQGLTGCGATQNPMFVPTSRQ